MVVLILVNGLFVLKSENYIKSFKKTEVKIDLKTNIIKENFFNLTRIIFF